MEQRGIRYAVHIGIQRERTAKGRAHLHYHELYNISLLIMYCVIGHCCLLFLFLFLFLLLLLFPEQEPARTSVQREDRRAMGFQYMRYTDRYAHMLYIYSAQT